MSEMLREDVNSGVEAKKVGFIASKVVSPLMCGQHIRICIAMASRDSALPRSMSSEEWVM